jgi:4-alpha-glucanotransferase
MSDSNPPSSLSALRRLADRVGILPEYVDQSGRETHVTSDETRVALLAALGIDASSDEAAREALAELEQRDAARLVPPVRVAVLREGPAGAVRTATLTRPRSWHGPVHWEIELRTEDGAVHESEGVYDGAAPTFDVPLPTTPPLGYHELFVGFDTGVGELVARQSLIVVPPACPSPAELLRGRRVFGVTANLYTTRSRHNWGAGDFTDLGDLLEWSASAGAAFVGVNPLHALRNRGGDISPYSPVSRLFRNPLYLDVEAVPELAESPEARALLADDALQSELARLRATRAVEYDRVMAAKRPVLEALHRTFREWGVGSRESGSARQRHEAYEHYVAEQGTALEDFATFCALEEWFTSGAENGSDTPTPHSLLPTPCSWTDWPNDYQDPDSDVVAAFRDRHADAVDFHRWLQFELDRQLAEAARRGRAAGMPLGVYPDLAIGTATSGSDPWAFAGLFVQGACIGAPPDPLAPSGQNWGLPPIHPQRLAEDGYHYWVALVRSALRHSGALRIDHVLGLFRQFWIPAGREGSDGAYLRFPTDDLFGILALESTRAGALVVGEDLGTVPPEVPGVLERWGVLSSKVLYFEREPDGGFRRAAGYPTLALTTANTHDLATLEGFWLGRDIQLRGEVGMLADAEVSAARRARAAEREALRRLLVEEGVLRDVPDPSPLDVRAAVHAFLRRTPSWLVGLSLDDLVGEVEPVNMPGVPPEKFSSWTRRLSVPLEALRTSPDVGRALGGSERSLIGSTNDEPRVNTGIATAKAAADERG